MTEQTILTPIESINEFYRLKDKYESGYYEKYVKPIIKSNKSKREKRVEFSKLPKHECINCKRNVGTLFNIKIDVEDNNKIFKANCGDVQDPCPLDIQIKYANRESIDKITKEGLIEIEKIKLEIIKEKNNALFFKKNVLNIFNKLTEQLKFETEHIGFIIETDILRNDNPEKNALLRQTIDEFGKGFILPFKQMVKDFDETNNVLILNQAVTFYINEMIPKLKEIQLLKYDVNIVEYDESNDSYKLIQLPNSLESNEFFYKEDDKVIKFVRGVKKAKKKTRKDESELKSKNVTRKIRPIAEIILEDEEEEPQKQDINPDEETEVLEGKFEEIPNTVPIFDEAGNVRWNNREYDLVWNSVPSKLKELLLQDHEWLEDFINNCIKLKAKGNPCKLFLPKQTKFPPTIDKDGKYDFGSDIVTKLFNSLPKQQQDILLTVYSIKNGVKNYESLSDTLALILAKDINFEKGYF